MKAKIFLVLSFFLLFSGFVCVPAEDAIELSPPAFEDSPWSANYYDMILAFTGCLAVDLGEKYEPIVESCFDRLIAIAEDVPDVDGYRWKTQGKNYYTGGHGTWQLGIFFIKVYEKTKDERALEAEAKLARWIVSVAEKHGDAYRWPDNVLRQHYIDDFAHGTAGIAYHLAKVYSLTRDERFKSYAIGAGNWFKNTAIQDHTGLRWIRHPQQREPSHVGRCNGACGVAESMYNISLLTGDDSLLETADHAMHWVMSEAIKKDDGYCWYRHQRKGGKWRPENGAPLRFVGMQGLGKGVAGIGNTFLLAHLVHYERDDIAFDDFASNLHVLKKTPGIKESSVYLDYARGCAQYLMDAAMKDDDGYFWKEKPEYWKSNRFGVRDFDYCRGTLSVPLFFLAMWRATGEDVYKEYALQGGKWIDAQRVTEGGWSWWDPYHKGTMQAFEGFFFPTYILLKLGKDLGEDSFVKSAERSLETFLASCNVQFGGITNIPSPSNVTRGDRFKQR